MNFVDHILSRLDSLGVEEFFGIPGDFILPLFQAVENSPVNHVATCNELNAGYAADGYARLKGLGVAVVTYGPGAFSLINAVAGAYAERVPLLVISGAPTTDSYSNQPLLHHTLTDNYEASLRMFQDITAHKAILTNPDTAKEDFDRALQICLRESRPVYLEVPTDIQTSPCEPADTPLARLEPYCDEKQLELAVKDIVQRASSGRTVLFPGHEIHRHKPWRAIRAKIRTLAA